MKWICSQIGAREHYAIPRVLHREAKLESFYTDFWTNPIWKSCGNLFGKPELSTRFHQDLADGYAFGAQRQWPDGAAPELGVC